MKKELKIGIVGLGNMGAAHVGYVKAMERTKLAAVCDSREEVAGKIARENGAKAWTDPGRMMKSGEIDAVIIATPHYSHPELAVEAFRCGLHVMCEKPIAVHKADAIKMISAHRKNRKLVFSAMHQLRCDGLYGKLKKLIDSGELGEIRRICWINTNWFRTQRYYDSSAWRATWKWEGGGILLNQCPHYLDLLQWFFGMPSSVRAFCGIGKFHDIEVEDDVTAYLEYPDGATGVYMSSTGESPGTNRLEISCDRGRLVVEGGKISFNRTEISVSKFCRESDKLFGGPDAWNVDVPCRNDTAGHRKILENFRDAILDGAGLIVDGEDGINSVELANAMILSSMKNKTVKLPINALGYERLLKGLMKKSNFGKKKVKAGTVDFAASFTKT